MDFKTIQPTPQTIILEWNKIDFEVTNWNNKSVIINNYEKVSCCEDEIKFIINLDTLKTEIFVNGTPLIDSKVFDLLTKTIFFAYLFKNNEEKEGLKNEN